MNLWTRPLILLAPLAMLSTSLVARAEQVFQFQASLNADNVVRGGVVGTPSTATGVADFVLTIPDGDPAGMTMSYSIQLDGIDLDGRQTPGMPADDITALHFHDTTMCSPASPGCEQGVDTVGTVHVLNVYGFPRLDDADVMAFPDAGRITGIWDDGDENLTFPKSNKVSEPFIQQLLFDELLFVNVHTNESPAGAIGGFIRLVPEPGMGAFSLVWLGLFLARSRRR